MAKTKKLPSATPDPDIIKLEKYTCPKCGHSWVPRYPRKPGVCPACKRYDWDKPHVGKNVD